MIEASLRVGNCCESHHWNPLIGQAPPSGCWKLENVRTPHVRRNAGARAHGKSAVQQTRDFDMVLCPHGTPRMAGRQNCHGIANRGRWPRLSHSHAWCLHRRCERCYVCRSRLSFCHRWSFRAPSWSRRKQRVDCQKRVSAIQLAGLTAILCIGETAEERSAGDALKAIETQLRESIPDKCVMANLVIAYETCVGNR